MSAIRIASRYAKSLLELASAENKLETIVGDINLFREAVSNRELYMMIKSPIIKADKKQSIFTALFGDRVNPLTSSFFEIIIKKGREQYLPEISDEFLSQYRTLKNITTASVTTAVPLNQQQLDSIKSELKNLGLATGQVELHTDTDPELIGGFVLEIDDQLYDASVKNKLASIKKEILDNTYIKSL